MKIAYVDGMHLPDIAPAALLGAFVTAALAIAQLAPMGEAIVLVRVGTPAALGAADAAVLALPAPGYAVLRGDAARIRRAMGLTVLWNGAASCQIPP